MLKSKLLLFLLIPAIAALLFFSFVLYKAHKGKAVSDANFYDVVIDGKTTTRALLIQFPFLEATPETFLILPSFSPGTKEITLRVPNTTSEVKWNVANMKITHVEPYNFIIVSNLKQLPVISESDERVSTAFDDYVSLEKSKCFAMLPSRDFYMKEAPKTTYTWKEMYKTIEGLYPKIKGEEGSDAAAK